MSDEKKKDDPKPPILGLDAKDFLPANFDEKEEPKWDPDIDAPPIPRYLSANRLHIFGGSPGSGKSTLFAQIAKALTAASDFFGLPCNKKNVKFLFTDRSLISNIEPLKRLGVDDLPMLSLVDSPKLLKLEEELFKPGVKKVAFPTIKLLEAALDELGVQPGDVVIVDVFTNGFCGDVHRQATLGPILRHVAALCLRRRITIFGSAYGVKIVSDVKALYTRLIDRIVGAQSIRGSADGMWYIAHPEEGASPGVQQLQIVSREAPKLDLMLVNKDGILELETKQDAVARVMAEKVVRAEKKAPARDAILPLIPFEAPIEFSVLYAAFVKLTGRQVVPSTISEYLSDLLEDGKVEKDGHGLWRRKES